MLQTSILDMWTDFLSRKNSGVSPRLFENMVAQVPQVMLDSVSATQTGAVGSSLLEAVLFT